MKIAAAKTMLALGVGALVLWGCGGREKESQPAEQPAEQAKAPATEVVEVQAKAFGTLKLAVPAGARIEQRDLELRGPVEAHIKPPEGNEYSVTVAVLGPESLMPNFGTDAWLNKELDSWTERIQAAAMNTEFPHQRLEAEGLHGYYVTATDANPKPGSYSHVFHGFFNIDGCVVAFGAVHTSKDEKAVEPFVDILKSAKWSSSLSLEKEKEAKRNQV